MIGLDTNILVRAATDDDAVQSPRARSILANLTPDTPGVLNSVVLAEFAWTMRRGYRYDRLEIVEAIEGIMRSPGLVTLDRDAINAAINRCREENLHFADALIGELNRSAGCATTLTFDGKAMKAEGLFSAPE